MRSDEIRWDETKIRWDETRWWDEMRSDEIRWQHISTQRKHKTNTLTRQDTSKQHHEDTTHLTSLRFYLLSKQKLLQKFRCRGKEMAKPRIITNWLLVTCNLTTWEPEPEPCLLGQTLLVNPILTPGTSCLVVVGNGTATIVPVGKKGRWLPTTPSGCLEVDLRAALAHFWLGKSVQR